MDNYRPIAITTVFSKVIELLLLHRYSDLLCRGGSRGRGGGGGPGPPLSETLGIDFYSGFRKKIQVYTFIVASEKKKHKGGGVQFEILRNPGIDFYSGFREKSRYTLL